MMHALISYFITQQPVVSYSLAVIRPNTITHYQLQYPITPLNIMREPEYQYSVSMETWNYSRVQVV